MVTTVTAYTDARNRAAAGTGYDGVVRVSSGGFYGTGVLLYDGMAVLTAAHLFAHDAVAATVLFETASGSRAINASRVTLLSSYDAVQSNDDLALVWLAGSAPLAAERYDLYRASDEIGHSMTLVGYGVPGTGAAGTLDSYTGAPVRLKAANQFDADAAHVKRLIGAEMGWSPAAGSQLMADFDNGATTQDALGRLLHAPSSGLGINEGLISPGDSGGPAFIGTQVAGIASYGTSLTVNGVPSDIDGEANDSFGELSAWQRVSHYQQWIDQSLRAAYAQAPASAAEVVLSVAEGPSGTSLAFFLLQFSGLRSDPQQLLSVDYATRNGSATAGRDYLPAHGTLVLYPGENQAVIPVEIVGDTVPEPDETFYLDVSNPVGGSFGAGQITLTAMRTIVNDDGGIWA